MDTSYVAETFDIFKSLKIIRIEELKKLKYDEVLIDCYGEQWNVIAIGTYDEVKQYDESGSAKDMLSSDLIKEDEILVAAKSKTGEISVWTYGYDGLIKENEEDSPYSNFDVISVGLECENNSTNDIYFNIEGNEFVVVNISENGEESVITIDEDEFNPVDFGLDKTIWEKVFVNEARFQIKRKYSNYSKKLVNEQTPLRNSIIRFIGKRNVTDDDLKNFLENIEENRGKFINCKKWFKDNKQYFKMNEKGGEKFWILSKFGLRIFDKIETFQRNDLKLFNVISNKNKSE